MTIRTWILSLVLTISPWTGVTADPATLQLGRGEVRVVCPLTIGGTFEAKTTAVAGSLSLAGAHPPAYSGDVSVDLHTLDTGISLRNTHLRDRYLEVSKGDGFDKAVVSEIRLTEVDAETFQGRTTFTGTLLLHGTKNPIAGQVQIRRGRSAVQVEAAFPVRLTDYGIAKPQYLGVGVKNEVQVRVTFDLTPSAALSTPG